MIPDKYNCICCNKEIPKLDGMPNDKEWEGMWRDGVVEKVSAGYGSLLDGNMYVIAICDSCLKEKHENGVIRYVGNYMYSDDYKGGQRRKILK
jgi:hypothetical protein